MCLEKQIVTPRNLSVWKGLSDGGLLDNPIFLSYKRPPQLIKGDSLMTLRAAGLCTISRRLRVNDENEKFLKDNS